MASVLTVREYAERMALDGDRLAGQMMDALDAADDVYAIADEFGELAPDVTLQDEARRLRTFEQRVLTMLEEWGAIDPHDPSPPDPIAVLRMLLG